MSTPVLGVLFDLDGVLVDACDLHRRALDMALDEVGYTITDEEHFDRYNGRPTKVKLQMLTEEKGLPVELHGQVSNRKQDLTLELIGEVVKMNHPAASLLTALQSRVIGVAVCSNSIRVSVEKLLMAAGLRFYVSVIVGNDEGFNPKPAPDLFLAGAERLGVPIENCVIVEDSPVGLQAAYAANPLRVIQVSGPSEVNMDLLPRLLGV